MWFCSWATVLASRLSFGTLREDCGLVGREFASPIVWKPLVLALGVDVCNEWEGNERGNQRESHGKLGKKRRKGEEEELERE